MVILLFVRLVVKDFMFHVKLTVSVIEPPSDRPLGLWRWIRMYHDCLRSSVLVTNQTASSAGRAESYDIVFLACKSSVEWIISSRCIEMDLIPTASCIRVSLMRLQYMGRHRTQIEVENACSIWPSRSVGVMMVVRVMVKHLRWVKISVDRRLCLLRRYVRKRPHETSIRRLGLWS